MIGLLVEVVKHSKALYFPTLFLIILIAFKSFFLDFMLKSDYVSNNLFPKLKVWDSSCQYFNYQFCLKPPLSS
jgi:hypothetical protein